MNIGVVGTNTWNKGMDLIQVAIGNHMRNHPKVKLSVPGRFGSFDERAQYGLRYLVPPLRTGRASLGVQLLPGPLRQAFGVVLESELDAMIDASGFAFGDQHPVERTLRFAEDVERWRKQGMPVVVLPQALGPFEKPGMKEAFARVLKAANLVYAREKISLEYARQTYPEATSLRLVPDFTNLVKPLAPEEVGSINRACIVPNQRMIEKAESQAEIDAYLPFLETAVQAVEEHDVKPVLLVHGLDDRPLVEAVQRRLGRTFPVIEERDPVGIKAELGRSRLVIASRFHALASALSQGVPSIGTSWSHKYEMLFDDYGCPDLVLPMPVEEARVKAAVSRTLGVERPELIKCLHTKGENLEEQVHAMWEEVDQVLGL